MGKKTKKLTWISVLQILTVAALLGYMQFAVKTGRISKIFIAAPTDIVTKGTDLAVSGRLWPHLLLTLQEVLAGYALAAGVGILIGFLWVLFPKLEKYMSVFCSAIMAVPKTAVFEATRLQLVFRVMVPAALPSVFNGLRLAAATALTGVVFAEMQSAKAGLGFLLSEAQNNLDTARVFFIIILITLISVGFVKIIQGIEYIVCHKWRKV